MQDGIVGEAEAQDGGTDKAEAETWPRRRVDTDVRLMIGAWRGVVAKERTEQEREEEPCQLVEDKPDPERLEWRRLAAEEAARLEAEVAARAEAAKRPRLERECPEAEERAKRELVTKEAALGDVGVPGELQIHGLIKQTHRS